MKFSNVFLVKIIVSLSLLAFISGCGSARNTVFEFKTAINEQKWDNAWNLLTSEDQKHFENNLFKPFREKALKEPDQLGQFKLTKEQVEKMSAKDFFAYAMSQASGKSPAGSSPVMEVEVERKLKNTAIIKIKNDPKEYLVKKQGFSWKISLQNLEN